MDYGLASTRSAGQSIHRQRRRGSPWRSLLPAAALAIALLPAGALPAIASDPLPADASVATEEEEGAIAFRKSLGFASGLDLVRAVAADPVNQPSELGGTPLTKAETAELLRRMEVQWATVPAMQYANAEPDFAGGFIDQIGGGVPVFLFTDRLDTHKDNITRVLETPIEFRVERAERSLGELLAQQAAIDEQRPTLKAEGTRIVETAILVDRNEVLIGIDGLTAGRAAAVTDVFGQGLVFEESNPAHADCVNGGDCRPIKGGIAVTSSTGWPCTSGFVVKQSGGGPLRLLTAGHCLDVAGDEGIDWKHDGIKFGDALKDTWQYPNYVRTADVGLIDIDSGELSQMTRDNDMHRGAGEVWPVIGSVNGANQMQGTALYRYGRASGTDSGLINGLYANRESCVGPPINHCMTVTKTIRVNFDSIGGDSGGPYWYYVPAYPGPGLRVIAMGTHVHSEEDGDPLPWWGWYSPVDVGAAQYLANWDYTYSLCVTAGC